MKKKKTPLEKMVERQILLKRQLRKLESQIRTEQGVYTSQIKITSYSIPIRETALVRWHLEECILCRNEGVATRYPGQKPRICDDCYGSEMIKNNPSKAKYQTKKETKRRIANGEAMPSKATRMDEED